VRFFDGNNLPGTGAAKEDVIHSVRRGIWGPVVQVGSKNAVLIRKLMIDTRSNEVFVHNLLTSKSERREVVAAGNGSVLNRVESKVLLGGGIHGYGVKVRGRGTSRNVISDIAGAAAHGARPGRIGRHSCDFGYTFRLSDPLEVSKEKRMIFYDRPANRTAKLVSLKRRFPDGRIFKEIPRVQGAIAEELIGASVEPA